MTDSGAREAQFERWLRAVDRNTRRHAVVDRTLREDQSGPLTLPTRFFFKILEIGPTAAFKLAWNVLADRFGQR